jgi:excinuclease UvrABC nuclease subunit
LNRRRLGRVLEQELVPESPGVYVISIGRPSKRFRKTDPEGRILIGQADNLRRRLSQFFNAAKGRQEGHAEGIRLYKLKRTIRVGDPASLRVEWIRARTPSTAEALEGAMLRRYEREFGDLPPLNRTGGVPTSEF